MTLFVLISFYHSLNGGQGLNFYVNPSQASGIIHRLYMRILLKPGLVSEASTVTGKNTDMIHDTS